MAEEQRAGKEKEAKGKRAEGQLTRKRESMWSEEEGRRATEREPKNGSRSVVAIGGLRPVAGDP